MEANEGCHTIVGNFSWYQYIERMESRTGVASIGDKVHMTQKSAVDHWVAPGMNKYEALATFNRRLCGDDGDWDRGECADTALSTVDNFVGTICLTSASKLSGRFGETE